MSASKRVIIDKAQPGQQYKVGQSYIMPAIAADAFIKKGHAHVFGTEDWARQQLREEEESKARKEAKTKRKAEQKAHAAEVAAARPLVEARDALATAEKRLESAEKRLESAETPKATKDWKKTVKVIKAEQKAAQDAVAKLGGGEPEPEADTSVEGEGQPPKIEMS